MLDGVESVRERLQAARVDVDAVDADRALALLESRLFARERVSRIGRYEVLARLGQGGGGVVWLAHDPELDRRVALKVLQAERLGDGSTGRRRLVREARALARFAHPNVVEIYGIEPRGAELVLVMEYVPGESVASWLDGETRSVDEVLAVFVAAGEGLAAVHALGLVHRDFKPANVMLTPSGVPGHARVKVLDFGLAGLAVARGAMPRGSVDASGEITMPGGDATLGDGDTLVGTPLFMAPEQHLGRPVDARTDQFAFCVSLWLALFGTPPFVGRDLDELARSKQGALPRAPRRSVISRATFDVIARGLASDPGRRWPSMRALLDALARSRKPRRLLPAVAIAAVGTAILATALQPSRTACADADERLAGVWDDARRNGLRVDRHADATLAALEAKLDDHAASWREAWR
ncbi:MAG TPA: serine/threonine-protein kinase, partial [Nannocystaceae bacterium]|nr:serine/threonine-protein kinase [Nannocystaceae bacterium]